MTGTREQDTWTIAYRTRRANHFKRVTNWSGTWRQAYELAGRFVELHPELQVYYVPSVTHERAEFERMTQQVLDWEITQDLADRYFADHGNVMVDSGKRIKVRETGTLTPQELALAVPADETATRFNAGVAS